MNIYQKLLEVRKSVSYLQKENAGQQYKYVSSSQVLTAVRAKLDEVGLLLITEVTDKNLIVDTVKNSNKDGHVSHRTTYLTELTLMFTWVNVENPEETIKIPFYAQGVDIAGEKGVGKALTYAEKYFILKQFNIATDKDDPDAHQSNNNKGESQQGSISGVENKASDKQLNFINTLLDRKTSEQYPKETLYRVLKGKLGVETDMENWTKSQAKQAIDILQQKEQQGA